MTDTHITAAMRSVLGKEFARSTSFPVSASDIRRWAVAVYYPAPAPPEFWDGTTDRLQAPQEFNPFAWMPDSGPVSNSEDPDRHFALLGVEGPGLEFQVNGGMAVAYGVPMLPGDVITSSSSIAELTERPGRMGLMLFTTIETVLTNQDGAEVLRQRTTIIRY